MRFVLLAVVALLSACAQPPSPRPADGAGQASTGMVAAANPLAVEAGLEVLRAGGNAADAAVAVQAALGLVEPQSSGLGGGGFMVYFDAATGKVSAYNGREHAPAGATAGMFLDAAGKPLPFEQAVVSGRAVGAPGAVAMLGMVHRDHGRKPWPSLFTGTIRLAERGFAVSPRLSSMINGTTVQVRGADASAYFSRPDGTRLQTGDILRNPAYAATLRRIAADGPRALLEGPLAEAIVARVRQGPLPGSLTLADLAAYQPERVDPLCRPWRVYVVCVPPPPSSGVGVLQLLLMLEHTDIDRRGPADPQGWYLFAEASRLMYADRDRYVGDPRYVDVPVEGLLDPAYVRRRAALIGPRAGPPPSAGIPAGAPTAGLDRTLEPAGTTHFVITDRWGNVASMTTTVESIFGSGRMVGGFFLNNQLTDFSFNPVNEQGRPVANAVAPRKRPRSSMSPIIVLDRQGRFVAAVGSPGGNSIPAYNTKTMVGVFDWSLSMQEAIDLPNLVARGALYSSEREKFAPGVVEGLAARGVNLQPGRSENSGLHGILWRNGRLEGGADPRREGVARRP